MFASPVEDDGRKLKSRVTRTSDPVGKDRDYLAVYENASLAMIAGDLNINPDTVRLIIREDLGMRIVCARIVPNHLTDDTNFAKSIVIVDETWCFQWCVFDQPPYSPDLAPCDLFLVSKLKLVLKSCFFDDEKTIKEAALRRSDN